MLARRGAALLALAALTASCAPAEAAPSGTWGSAGGGQPFLKLASDGSLGGFDGCNWLGGSWRLDDGRIVFAEMYTTAQACPDVDAWLARMAAARVDGDRLVLLDATGDELGALGRVG
jgi:heat shock protein HslJ